MSKEVLPPNMEEEPIKETEIDCDFCEPGTLALWDVVTEDGVMFVCNKHHMSMTEANLILLERRIGDVTWEEINEVRGMLNKEDYLASLIDLKNLKDYE
jgi:hypothetical protein